MRAKCKRCGDTVEVTRPREFKSCKCGAINLDYGDEFYYRVGGNPEDFDGEIEDAPKIKYPIRPSEMCNLDESMERAMDIIGEENIVSLENCQEKVAYKTVNLAYKGKRLAEKYGHIMEVYKCPHCKKYHLTKLGEME